MTADFTGALPGSTLQVRSTITGDGEIRLALTETALAAPGDEDVVIAVEAAPINPADLLCLLAGALPAELRFRGEGRYAEVSGTLPPPALRAAESRIDRPMPVGLVGAGRVVAAGRQGQHLVGKRVSARSMSLGMYSQYCTVSFKDCMQLSDRHSARDGADVYCNPLTALAIVETLHQTGQTALVHTAAASSLGQMLVRICRDDDIPLVNIVRREEQAALLQKLGARYVCNSASPRFRQDLLAALHDTGAMVAFDAIGGGPLASDILSAMEAVASARLGGFHPYGTSQDKRVYVYGRLDPSPTLIPKGNYGMVWGVDGWAMPPVLERAGPERADRIEKRISDDLTTTFATEFAQEISLAELLRPEALLSYCRQATGAKYLVNPQLGLA